jgi:outer membrane protein OmpA-like peptidoglycan-associated protein
LHAAAGTIGPAAALLLAGCASLTGPGTPVDWWHSLEGGRIAGQRPPPPKADAPYPDLGSVPPRPVPTDAPTRLRIAGGLVADRANAQYATAQYQAPPASGRSAPRSAPPPAASDTPSASLLAATARPAAPRPQPPFPDRPAPPPRPAPLDRVESAPLAPPPAASAPTDAAPVTVATAVTMPAAPPPPPRIPGVDVPAATVPTPPPVAPPAPAPVPAGAKTATTLPVPFLPGSADIPPETQDSLRALVQRRDGAPLAAIGYGDASGGDPAGQSAALPLALARARAIAAVLMASGVPASLVQLRAEAEGRGGVARIVDTAGAAPVARPVGDAHATN